MKITRTLLAAAITFMSAVTPTASPQPPATPTTVHRFAAPIRAGMAPMVEAPDGTLFGIAESGGVGDQGAVFTLTPDGSGGFTFSILHQFNGLDGEKPTGLTYSTLDDTLYGTTQRGGVDGPIYDGNGTVFSLTRAGILTTLVDFNLDFSTPQPLQPSAPLLEASDGNFYGTGMASSTTPGSGAIFTMDRDGIYAVLHVFSGADGNSPASKLVEGSDGLLYGTTLFGGTNDAGTVFRIAKDGSAFETLHSFTGDPGAVQPRGLVRDTAGGADVFYGLTGGGGTDGRGSVFRITPAGTFTSVASFPVDGGGNALEGAYPNGALVKGPDGLFYATTEAGGPGFLGGVFSLDPATGTLALVHDFNSDVATGLMTNAGLLLAADGTLLGTTVNGGAHRVGTIYRVDTSVAPAAVAKVIDIPSLGPAFPAERMLRASDGHLYGTTSSGGAFNSGTIFRFSGGVVTMLHSFNFADGHSPSGELVEGSDGNLYGTTIYGGNIQFPGDFGGGTVFRISKGGAFTMLHAFSDYSVEGAQPLAGLVEGPDGNFYGTTHQNGPGGAGTVFKMTPAGDITTLHSFDVWSATRGTLVIGEDGYFYGVTREGGSNPNGGTIYKIDSAGNFVLLHEFIDPADGAHPNALVLGTDGNLYGTTEHGGPFFGTLFRITPAGTLTVLHRFDRDVDGSDPMSAPLEAGDGKWYGSTWLGGRFPPFFSGLGTLYRYDSTGLQLLHTFGGVAFDPGSPFAGLTQGSDNLLYGSTENWPGGTLFSFDQGITNKAPTARSQQVTIGPGETANVNVVASDPDGNPITFLIVDQPDNGTLSGSGPSFAYEPNPGFSGTDAFRVRVNDGTVSSPVAGVLITVGSPNTAPVANDQRVTTSEDTAAPLTLTGSDVDGNALSFTVVTPPSHGALSGTAPNLTYTPAPDYSGPDSFTFKANDGSLDSSVATVSITVDPVNDAPVAQDLPIAAGKNTPHAIALVATDVDGDALTLSPVTSPAHGVLSGTAPNLIYTPTADYTGPDSFTFKANDGTVDSNVATVSITVAAVNTPPVVFALTVSVMANTPTPILLGASDADGDPLTFFIVTPPAHGVLSGSAPNVTYTPDSNYVGPDTFTYNANDGTADGTGGTVFITVTAPANRPPVANAGGPYIGDLGAAVTFDGSGSSDLDIPFGDTLFYGWTIVTSAGSIDFGGGPTRTVPAFYVTNLGAGTFVVSLRVTDGAGLEHTAQTTITVRAPIASFTAMPNPAACGQGIAFDASASDNTRPGRFIATYLFAFGDGTTATGRTGMHPYSQYGSYQAELTVIDDLGISASSQQTIIVNQGNQPPAADAGGPYVTSAGSGVAFTGAGSSDPNAACGDSIVSHDWTVNGTIALTGATPSLSDAQITSLGVGTFPVQLTVTDEFGLTLTALTTLTVQPVTIATTTELQVSATTLGALQPVTLTATVAPVAGGGVPSGDVEFLNATTVIGVATLQAGVATLNTNASANGGTFSLTARYLGAVPFTGSLSAPVTLTVRSFAESTYTFVIPWTNARPLGSPFTVSAIVLPLAAGTPVTGSVDFYEGASLVATTAVSGGLATATWTPSAAGTLSISARYAGSPTLAPSWSQPVLVTVFTGPAPAATTTSVAAAPTAATLGQPVTFTATLSNNVPAGSVVTFVADGALLGTGVVTNVGGVNRATWTTSGLALGLRIVSASYGGAPGLAASNAAAIGVVITP